MFQKIVFYDNYTNTISSTWSAFLVQGIVLLSLGLLILIWPALLVAMVAAAFLLSGVLFIVTAVKIRALRKNYQNWRDQYWE